MNTIVDHHQAYRFTATHCSGAVVTHELAPNVSVFIGSSSNCGFRLIDETVSPIHCHLTQESGRLFIKDWMSNTGTRVNGHPIEEICEIEPDSVLEVGAFTISIVEVKEVARPDSSHDFKNVNRVDESAPLQCDVPESSQEVETEDPFDFGSDIFELGESDEEGTYDLETVQLLRAEIDDLRTALAQRDADDASLRADQVDREEALEPLADASENMLKRMQELIDEANHSDEKVSLLEDLLLAAEDANRSEQEERRQLEAWVGDIENRIIQREEEHAAEIDALQARLKEAAEEQLQLQLKLKQAAQSGNASKQYDESLESLQKANQSLQSELAQARQSRLALEQRVEQLSSESAHALREERASIAKEQAKLARMRYEISNKIADVENLPKGSGQIDQESAARIQALRHHLREIHEQEKMEERETSLASRLSKLWKRVE